jgi:hypothetical protein
MNKEPINIEKLARHNVFIVPNDYFETLHGIVIAQCKFNPQAKNNKGFKTPENYFDSLSSKIISKINQKPKFSLDKIPNVNVFKVSDGYFDDLEERVSEKVLLSNLPKGNIFIAPNGYFEALTPRIESRVRMNQNNGIFRIIIGTKIWAAAASIIVLFGLAWFFIPNLIKTDVEIALEKASVEEIQSYLNTQDLSYLEYENSVVEEYKTAKQVKTNADSLLIENLNLEQKDILEHIEDQNLDENELEYLLGS